uniref:Uncharacterized protein n=1 Tax=Spongospora subterranea TaxID=70186 RepID=A0A0H5R8M4_9EUKA|eukprot:CRZ10151.1 hypothetical protein [Spongospora subterranea]
MSSEQDDIRKRRAAERRAKILASSASRMAVVEGTTKSLHGDDGKMAPSSQTEVATPPAFVSMACVTRLSQVRWQLDTAMHFILWVLSAIIGVNNRLLGWQSSYRQIVAIHLVVTLGCFIASEYARYRLAGGRFGLNNDKLMVMGDVAELILACGRAVSMCIDNLALVAFTYVMTGYLTTG